MGKHKKSNTSKRIAKIVGIFSLFALAVGIGVGGASYQKLNNSVKSEDFTQYLKDRPEVSKVNSDDPNAGRDLNYVLIGSDSREGEANSSIGGGKDQGMRSDTTIIAHISRDRDRIDMISIPRDSIVNIPSCVLSNGSETMPEYDVMFNSAFSKGHDVISSVSCTISTIEQNTGLYIDGYAVVDFSGFENMVTALGGIEFDVPHDMVSKKAKLDLKAGKQKLDGQQSLGYARARTFEVGASDGSDLSRITRQQDLLKAFAKQTLSAGTIANPVKAYNVAESVLDSVTVSPDLGSINDLSGFAYSLRNISPDEINFYTVPNMPWLYDKNRVIWTEEANDYWNALKNDELINISKNDASEISATG